MRLSRFCIFLASAVLSSVSFAHPCVQWQSSVFNPGFNSQGQISPDTGMYWYKTDAAGKTEVVTKACQKGDNKEACFARLKKQGFFDPNRKTIVFIHGWQPSSMEKKDRFDLCFQYTKEDGKPSQVYNTLKYWKNWNVAVFYWNQFADEDTPYVGVVDAEAKIYSTDAPNGMRWAYLDDAGKRHYCSDADSKCIMPKQTVVDMAYDAFINALPNKENFKGDALRITGQSLGTQIAIQLTDRVMNNPALPQPTRLVLLDPYFSPDDDTINTIYHLPKSVADFNSDKVTDILKINPNFAISEYRTSKISFAPTGNPGWSIANRVAYNELYPKFFDYMTGNNKLEWLHKSATYIYFQSMKAKPLTPPQLLSSTPSVRTAPYINANTTPEQVRDLMSQSRYQLPSDGENKFPKTDEYIFTDKKPA